MEHIYNKIQGWFACPWLYTHVVNLCEANRKYTFIEVGCWKGRSTSYMAVEIINSGKDIKFYAVDTWVGSVEHFDKTNASYEPMVEIKDALYNNFLQNIEPVKSVIIPVRSASLEAVKQFPDNSVDFILLDAAHDYDNVKSDIQSWWPKLVSGGIMAGDDLDWPGIIQAIKEIWKTDFISIDNKIWIKQKE